MPAGPLAPAEPRSEARSEADAEVATGRAERAAGRPRDAGADERILAATRDLLLDAGYRALTIEAVAGRAGVGKTTIYRRWPGKRDLVIAAIHHCRADLPATEVDQTAGTRDALAGLLRRIVTVWGQSSAVALLPAVVAEMHTDPLLAAAYRDQVVGPKRAVVRGVVVEGVRRGDIRPDLAVDDIVDLLVGPVMYRMLTRAILGDPPEEFPEHVVDSVLTGVGLPH